jgi:hypothetical protein
MDASNYDGLTEISVLEDWLAFERDVRVRPQMILDRQQAFVERLAMPTDPVEVYRRFTRLIVGCLVGDRGDPRVAIRPGMKASGAAPQRKRRAVAVGELLVEAPE